MDRRPSPSARHTVRESWTLWSRIKKQPRGLHRDKIGEAHKDPYQELKDLWLRDNHGLLIIVVYDDLDKILYQA